MRCCDVSCVGGCGKCGGERWEGVVLACGAEFEGGFDGVGLQLAVVVDGDETRISSGATRWGDYVMDWWVVLGHGGGQGRWRGEGGQHGGGRARHGCGTVK